VCITDGPRLSGIIATLDPCHLEEERMPDRHAGGDPWWLAIARDIAAQITAGTVQPGDRLPAAHEIATTWGVSVGTVTRGLQTLRQAGIVRGERGRPGLTVVRTPEPGEVPERALPLEERVRALEKAVAELTARLSGGV
jgi:DNA-binding GntR family transcriptional regulator